MSAVTIVAAIVLVSLVLFIVKRMTKKPTPAIVQKSSTKTEVRAPAEEQSSWGICKKCGEKRIIINKQVGYCAVCWSSSGSKPLA